jgi:NADPH:quinone reductase-like Zn-dependent oxidoreductase
MDFNLGRCGILIRVSVVELSLRNIPYAGSSVVGSFAIQLAKLAGLKVVTVASKKQHSRLRSLGAGSSSARPSAMPKISCSRMGLTDETVDRHDADAVSCIRSLTGNRLRYALDAIGKETAAKSALCLDNDCPAYLVGLTGLPKPDTLPKNVIAKGVVRNLLCWSWPKRSTKALLES